MINSVNAAFTMQFKNFFISWISRVITLGIFNFSYFKLICSFQQFRHHDQYSHITKSTLLNLNSKSFGHETWPTGRYSYG